MFVTALIAFAGVLAVFGLLVAFGALFWLPAYHAQLRAREAWPEVAASFYEEFERQSEILQGHPDPLPGQAIRRAGGFDKGEIVLASGKATFFFGDATYMVPVSALDTPAMVAGKLRRAIDYRTKAHKPRIDPHGKLGWDLFGRADVQTADRGMIGMVSTGGVLRVEEAQRNLARAQRELATGVYEKNRNTGDEEEGPPCEWAAIACPERGVVGAVPIAARRENATEVYEDGEGRWA